MYHAPATRAKSVVSGCLETPWGGRLGSMRRACLATSAALVVLDLIVPHSASWAQGVPTVADRAPSVAAADDGGSTPAPAGTADGATSSRRPADPDSPSIVPHSLEGRAACITCHGPAGRRPFPGDHLGRPSAACLSCHVPSQSSRAQVANTPTPPRVTNEYCLACHEKQDLKMVLPSGQELSLYIDKAAYAKSMHGVKHMSCTACHPDNQTKTLEASQSNAGKPHDAFTGNVARELNRGIIQRGCAKCHEPIFKQYRESVHGKALIEESNLDVPSCTDCHGIHNIRNPETMLFRLDSPDTCSKCRGDAALMGKYNLSANVTKSYLNDFHGTTVRLGRKGSTPEIDQYKAVCYDCHGIHDIKKVKDPASRVVRENLAETCRRCHPGSNANFPAAWTSHYEPDSKRWALVYWVNVFYKWAIPGILGGFVFYIALELIHELIVRVKRWRQG